MGPQLNHLVLDQCMIPDPLDLLHQCMIPDPLDLLQSQIYHAQTGSLRYHCRAERSRECHAERR